MSERQTIDFNPLETSAIANLIGSNETNQKKTLKTKAKQEAPPTKERMTVQLRSDLIERLKDCCYWDRITIAQFCEEALEEALKRAEKKRGSPFEKRASELRPGRPMK
jgi:acetylornithine/succinyldiaminopimelate/putrescine aminotransferase